MRSRVHAEEAPGRAPERPFRPTTLIEAPRLARRLGARLFLASETFQTTGSFKLRAAYHLAFHVPHARLITASSGNFGQALACACGMLGKSCTVVMPDTSARVKIEAVQEYGGKVDLIDVRQISRLERVAQLSALDPEAYVASAYDDPLVIEGNASLGVELGGSGRPFDVVLAPVGGGGLTAGLITGLRRSGHQAAVVGVEPAVANDAVRSLRAGRIIPNEHESQTLADGVRTLSLGRHNWDVLSTGLAHIVEVSEAQIRQAVALLFQFANLKAEPTGALPVAALLASPERFRDQEICCVISGGNVDPHSYAALLE